LPNLIIVEFSIVVIHINIYMRDNTAIERQQLLPPIGCECRVRRLCVLYLVFYDSQWQRTIVISKLLVFKYRSRLANPSYQQGLYFKAKVLKVYIGKIIFVYFGKLPYCDTEA
jgi:hypothetical protein